MSDDVMVRPIRTFMEGAWLKEPHHDPYPVSRSRALELARNGLVENVEPSEEPAPSELDMSAEEPPADPAAPARRGPGRPRKVR